MSSVFVGRLNDYVFQLHGGRRREQFVNLAVSICNLCERLARKV